jgi:transposase
MTFYDEKEDRAMGRRSKLTPEVRDALIEALSKGATYKVACALAGVSVSAFMKWKRKGEKVGSPAEFVQFVHALKRAKAEAHLHHIRKIHEADSWQASAWWLERHFPELYSLDRGVIREMKKFLKEQAAGGGAE